MHPLDILFWSCLALGGAYVVFTVLIGGLSHAAGNLGHMGDSVHLHHDGGIHVDHVGDGHIHADHGHHGDAHHHGHDHGHDGIDVEHSGRFNILAYVNPMSFSGFLLGFGGVGVLARMMKVPPGTSALAAGIGGVAMWYSAWFLIAKVFGASEGSSHTRREEVLGMKGTVTAPISGTQPGMVALTVGGSRQQVRAITEEEDPIPVGAQVRIRRLENNTAQVIRLQ